MLADHGIGPRKAGIDEDIACGGGYEIAGEVIGSDVVEIAREAKGEKILNPFGLEVGEGGQCLGGRRAGGERQDDGGGNRQEPGKFWHRFEMMRKDTKRKFILVKRLKS